MKKLIYIIGGVAISTLLLFNFTGCIDESFDDIQPSADTTTLKGNTTIAELKTVYTGMLTPLTDTTFYQRDSILIEGIVTSDDKEGNFYKTIEIQDNTGGIEVKLEKTTLYNDYKRGQRVVIYCNNLYLGDYGGLIQLGSTYTENGYTQLGGMQSDAIINKHVFRKGKTMVPVTPLTITPSLLVPSNLSKLIKVESVQFKTIISPITNDTLTFADKTGGESVDHYLMGFLNPYSNLVVRTSGYASFANDTIPSMSGSIVGILSYYNGTYQIIIRDLKDINFVNPRF